jgi:hypothetical protein
MSVSAIETVRGQFKTALETITTPTYRNDIVEVRESLLTVPGECPTITILFNGKTKLIPLDTAYTAFEITVPFTLVCDIEGDTDTGTTSDLILSKDSLLHDIMRVLIGLCKSQISETVRWNIVREDGITSTDVFPIKDSKTKGTFDVSGTIHIRGQGTSL